MKTQLMMVGLIIVAIGFALAYGIIRKSPKGHIIKKLIIFAYAPLAIWSVAFFAICLMYAGITLSWVWLWPLIAVFSGLASLCCGRRSRDILW